MAGAQAQSIPGSTVSDIFGPVKQILGKILYLIVVIIILLGIVFGAFVGYRYFVFQKETGQLASTVAHAEVGAEEVLSPFQRGVRKISPDLYAVLYPETYNPYAFDPVVDNSAGREVGVDILEFGPITSFFRPNTPVRLLGRIQAQGLDRETEIEVYCYLEDYNEKYHNDEPIPALLTGYGASNNKGVIPKDQQAEFQAQCNFPQGLEAERQVVTKRAKLIVVYNFATKSYQRAWFLEKAQLDSLQSNGVNPFDLYNIDDRLMDSDRKITSVTSPGPIKLGLAVDYPQPLTDLTQYLLMVQISRTFEEGNLQKLSDLRILVPASDEISIDLAGEVDLAGLTQCDFEYAGSASVPNYKEYRLAQDNIEKTNTIECDKKSLRELAISERDCIKVYKEPTYLCNFVVQTAPQALTSDTIRAEAEYSFKVEKSAVVDIKALPSEVGQTTA